MIIVRHSSGEQFFSASRKSAPGLISQIAKDKSLEQTIAECEYFEFNTTSCRTGEMNNFRPLRELVSVKVSLTADVKEDEEGEGTNAE